MTSSSTPPACFLISLQEGSTADAESVPQKVIHTLPVYYKHQAAACLSSLYFGLLSVFLTAVYPFASPHETTPSCLILCVWSSSCFGQSLQIVCLLYPLCFLLCLCLWNIWYDSDYYCSLWKNHQIQRFTNTACSVFVLNQTSRGSNIWRKVQ